MKILRDENGQTFVLTGLCMGVLLGFMGLALDVALAYHSKRNLQTAADDAAIAAALNYEYVVNGNPTTAAQSAAAKNGIASSYVTVNSNPTTGYHQGVGFFEVVVAKPQASFFAKVLGFPSFTVAARAVAGVTSSSSCVYITNPSSADTFKIKGNATVTANNCGIQVDSTSSSAFCDGGSASIAAPYVRLVGGQDTGGGCNKAPGATVFSGYASVSDPYANIVFPTLSQCNSNNTITVNNTSVTSSTPNLATTYTSVTAANGTTYKLTCFNDTHGGGQAVTLDGSTTALTLGTKDTAGMGQGQIFLFENGVTMNGSVTVNGTIDNYQGSFNNQNGQLTVTAPADKTTTFNGLALVQPKTNTTGGCQDGSLNNYLSSFNPNQPPCLQVQFGSTGEDLVGYIYAPSSVTYLQDQGGGVTAAGVVSYDMYINSKLTIKNSYNAANPSTTPLSKVALVE